MAWNIKVQHFVVLHILHGIKFTSLFKFYFTKVFKIKYFAKKHIKQIKSIEAKSSLLLI